MKQKVLRTGNSTAVTVPAKFVKTVGVKVGDTVKVKTRSDTGEVIYTFSGIHQLRLPQKPSPANKAI